MLQRLVALQRLDDCWNLDALLLEVMFEAQGVRLIVWASVLAITLLEGKMAGDKETREIVVEKAKA